MVPVYRHNAIPQCVNTGLNSLAPAIRALAVKPDYTKESPRWNQRQRYVLFGRLRAGWFLLSKPDLAIRGTVVRDPGPVFLQRLGDGGRYFRRWTAGRFHL